MARVHLTAPFYIDGYYFDAGEQEVPEQFLGRLPSSAKVIGAPAPVAAAAKAKPGPAPDDDAPKAKAYRFAPAEFKSPDGEKSVSRDEAMAEALKEVDGDVKAWNALGEVERRSKIEFASRQLLGVE